MQVAGNAVEVDLGIQCRDGGRGGGNTNKAYDLGWETIHTHPHAHACALTWGCLE